MTDLISRADAIEAVKETKPIVRSTERNWGKMIAEQHSKELVKALKALPSADAVYGKWLPIDETIPTYDGGEKTWITGMKCSNCGKLLDLRVGYYYCPNCGARMKGGEDE